MNKSVVFSIQNGGNANTNLPDILYIDTNSIAEVAFNRDYKSDVMRFVVKAAGNDTIFTYSPHTLDELLHTTHAAVFTEEAIASEFTGNPSKPKTPLWKQYENSGVNLGHKVIERYDEIVQMFTGLAPAAFIEISNPPDADWHNLTRKYILDGTAPKDAKHLAIMNYHGLNNILTLDRGFYRASNLNIYAPNYGLTKYSHNGDKPNSFKSII